MRLVEVGPQALTYARSRLSLGYELSQEILRLVPLDSGTFLAFLPDNITAEDAQNLDVDDLDAPLPGSSVPRQGGWERVDHEASDEALLSLLNTVTEKDPTGVTVFESSFLTRGEIARFPISADACFYNDNVWLYAEARPQPATTRLTTTLSQARGWLIMGAVGSLSPPIQAFESISPERLQSFVRQAYTLIFGAFDGESYLVWESKTTPFPIGGERHAPPG